MVGAKGEDEWIESGGTLGRPRMLHHSPKVATKVSDVPGIDDLLWVILLYLDYPTFLVRAACICKRWFRIISDPKFLRRFHELHPPCLVASYFSPIYRSPELVPPQGLPREFVAIMSRARSYFSHLEKYWCSDGFDIYDWSNGRVLISIEDSTTGFHRRLAVCSPLTEVSKCSTFPRSPIVTLQDYIMIDTYEFLPEDGGDGMSYNQVRILASANNRRMVLALVSTFNAGVWDDSRTSTLIELPLKWFRCKTLGLLVNGKFYMLAQWGYILGLDLMSMSLFLINLLDGVEQNYNGMLELSRADDSKFYLIHVKGLQLRVWLHDVNNNNETSNWLLIDTICLLELFDHLARPDWETGGSTVVLISRGGDNVEFVYLAVDNEVYLVYIKKRTVEKVFDYETELTPKTFRVHPFMMVWPPTFPMLNVGK